MDSKINYLVFEGEGGIVDEKLLEKGLTFEEQNLAREMMESGYYQDGLWVHRFLEQDFTINLEKLELAVILAIKGLEGSSKQDITLKLQGLNIYYNLRGIEGNEKQEQEERTFLLTFITSVAANISERDTLEVKFVL